MKTLRQLMNNTPQDVIARSRLTNANVLSVKVNKQKDVDTVVFTVRCRGHTEDQYYDTIIELWPTEVHLNVFDRPSMDNPVWVTCGCPFWHYYCQYAVSKTGSTSFVQFQGRKGDSMRFPEVKNRQTIPYLCKHLYRACPEVIKMAVRAANQDKRFKFV